MKTDCFNEHWVDDKGRPEGGSSFGPGFAISWQHGPLGRGADRILPNGAFVENVIAAVIDRIEHYQRSEFECEENAIALERLKEAAGALHDRTVAREEAGVEGTHEHRDAAK